MVDTLIGRFNYRAAMLSHKAAVTYKKDDKWADISYDELKNIVDSLTDLLLKEGVGKNDKVALILKNGPKWTELFFAAVSLGAVVVPVNPDAEPGEAIDILNDSGARLVFLGSESSRLARSISESCGLVKNIISVDAPVFKQALNRSASQKTSFEIFPDDIACILYTSGTTDEPKGVMLSHKNFISNADSIKSLNIITENDRVLSILPLHHIYPLTVTMIIPLIFGGTIVYPGTIRGEGLLEAMAQTNPTVFAAVPQVFCVFHQKIVDALKRVPFPFKTLLGRIIRRRRFGKSIRLFVSGGAKLDERVERDLLQLGFTILEGYGLTETSPILTMNLPGRIKIGSAGVAIPGVEIRIGGKDENGVGEVMARGANIMKGYYKRDDLTAQVLKDGWFYTGDLGYLDKDGYLFLTGRSKDLIVLSSGLKVYPDEIERVYGASAPVKELCVFEAPAAKNLTGNQVLWAVVVPNLDVFKKDAETNLREVIKANFDVIQAKLPPHKRLMGFMVTLEELPRTLLGKLKRFAVKEMYLPKIMEDAAAPTGEKTISEEDRDLLGTDLAKKTISYLKKHTRLKRDIVLRDSLELDLGIDSLGRIELAAGLEKFLHVKIEDEVIGTAFTVRDLIRNIEGLASDHAAGGIPGKDSGRAEGGPEYWARILDAEPNEENLKRLDLCPNLRARVAYSLVQGLCFLIFKLFYQLKVEGRNHLPKKGPYMLFANHTSFFDGALLGVSLPHYTKYDVFFLSFKKYFNAPVLRNLIKDCRIIPLDFFSHLTESLRSVYYVLKNGKNVCIFPEGRISLDGNVKDFKKGFGILVKETRATLIPVAIEGADKAWPRTAKFPRPHPIRVRFGEAVTYEKLEAEASKIKDRDSYDALCTVAREILVKLKGG
ncbi:MAG: AMP-binding protein [Candidatus Omnitrophica bacterium]|nr:AMP-binding protein [Candidatus Omnitrophota bacterium]